jgi:hypothetical protein
MFVGSDYFPAWGAGASFILLAIHGLWARNSISPSDTGHSTATLAAFGHQTVRYFRVARVATTLTLLGVVVAAKAQFGAQGPSWPLFGSVVSWSDMRLWSQVLTLSFL